LPRQGKAVRQRRGCVSRLGAETLAPGSKLRENVVADGGGAGGGGGGGSGDGDDSGDDDGYDSDELESATAFVELGGAARRHRAQMLGLVRPRVRAREAAALARLDSAALLNAVRPTRAWMCTAVHGGRADEPGASIPCLLCGCWWPCPLVRDKAFMRRACAACGYDGPELDVHYALGGVGSGGVCSCLRLAAARAAWCSSVYTASIA
jgi:hypothetical protein